MRFCGLAVALHRLGKIVESNRASIYDRKLQIVKYQILVNTETTLTTEIG